MIEVETGMVLAAGLGTRLRPITNDQPKALVTVQGRTLLDRAFDHLESVGVKRAVVNTHHKAEMIERHLESRKTPAITISHEPVLLDTGGGRCRSSHSRSGIRAGSARSASSSRQTRGR